jgi:AcrR family transcriptional regulator
VNTQARLLDAAFEVFADRGFEAATVEEICEAAGFTRGAFSGNFDTKEELFFALWSARAATILDDLAALSADLADEPDRVEETIDEMVRSVTRDRRWFLVSTEFLLHAIRNPATAETLAAHRRALRSGLAPIIATVLDARGTGSPDGIDVDTHARMIVAAIEGCQHQIGVEPAQLADGNLPVAMVRVLLD